MKEELEKRLEQLKTELDSGQKVLAELEAKQSNVTQALLRISGAIQVIEELLEPESTSDSEQLPVDKAEAETEAEDDAEPLTAVAS